MGNASLDGNFPFIPFIPFIPSVLSEKISCWALWINLDSASLNFLNTLNSLSRRSPSSLISPFTLQKNIGLSKQPYIFVCNPVITKS